MIEWLPWVVLALVAAATAVGVVLWLRNRPDASDVVDEKADAQKAVLAQATKAAAERVEGEYAETIKKLDEESALRAVRLRNNPVALAKFLKGASKS